jgi:hypothetical protein
LFISSEPLSLWFWNLKDENESEEEEEERESTERKNDVVSAILKLFVLRDNVLVKELKNQESLKFV